MQSVKKSADRTDKVCAVCGNAIKTPAPVDDLCGSCFEKEVMLSRLIEYLQDADAEKLNIIQSFSFKENVGCISPESSGSCKKSNQKAFLVRVTNKEKFELISPITVFGRSKEKADYVLPSNVMSGKHASVIIENNNYYLEDNSSSNGTWLNGQKLKPNNRTLLCQNDKIRFANEELIFSVM